MAEFESINVFRTSGLALEQHIRGHKLVQSEGDAWQGVETQIFRRAPYEDGVLVPSVAEPLIVWIIAGAAYIEERELDGEWQGRHVSEGDFFLTQADAPYMMRWQSDTDASFEVLHLYISLPILERVAQEIVGPSATPRLRDISGAKDALLSGFLAALRLELMADHPPSRIFIQGIAQSLAVHLIRHYSTERQSTQKRREQLPAFRLRQAVTLMLAHLDHPFDLGKMAQAAGMSRFHFSRAFRRSMGQSPSVWFIRQRIARARQLLRETDQTVIEIGLEVGYGSPSHFAQIFRRETGVSPSDYRAG